MCEVPQLEHFNQKNGYPEMINFFLYCVKKNEFFRLTEGYLPPTTGVVEL